MGYIFFIMGVSGAGKGTIIKHLRETNLDFHFPLSYKTREIRKMEKNGIDAFFVSKEEFFEGIKNEEFLEYAIVHGTDYYGTKYKDLIENGIKKGKIVIKEIDITGLKILKNEKPELDNFYTAIFLNIPNDILIKRIKSRGLLMQNDELERRINSAIIEEKESREICDFIIDATKTEKDVLEEVLKIIKTKKGIFI